MFAAHCLNASSVSTVFFVVTVCGVVVLTEGKGESRGSRGGISLLDSSCLYSLKAKARAVGLVAGSRLLDSSCLYSLNSYTRFLLASSSLAVPCLSLRQVNLRPKQRSPEGRYQFDRPWNNHRPSILR